MTQIDIHSSVFNDVYLPYLEDGTRMQIFFGGSASGKSVFEAQRCVWDMLQGKRNYLVARQVARTIRGSVATQIARVISDWKLDEFFSINKSDGTITCKQTLRQVVFVGLDDVEKLKSITPLQGSWTDVWVEEATEMSRDSLKQLLKRQRGGYAGTPKRMTLTFNPILLTHWLYKDYFASVGWTGTQKEHVADDLLILKTTYKDNKFLTASDINDLENEQDEYFYKVYTLGEWGILGDVIFTNWVIADLNDPDDEYYLPEAQRTNRRNGGDFGFSSDPAAVGVSHYDRMRKRIYVYDELYETELTNDLLAERVTSMIGDEPITFDSAEPKSITELRQHGVSAKGARKGKDSINHGIDWLKQQFIVIHKDCVNMINELNQYHWKKDAGGNSMKVPVDKNNHLIDGGLRYAYEDDMREIDLVEMVDFA